MKIEKSYSLPFPLNVVYSAWISSNTLIAPASRMEIEPKVGGVYRLIIDAGENSALNEGKFLEIQPQKLLRYTWEWNGDGEVSEICVRFEGTGGKTNIKLAHSGFTNQQSLVMHDAGWDSYIDGLEKFLARAN